MVENSGFQITRSFAYNSTNSRLLKIVPSFTGSGDGAAPFALQPTFLPSVSITNAYSQINLPTGNPDTGVTITNLYATYNRISTGSLAGAITNSFGNAVVAPSLGSLKPTNITGIKIENQGVSGVTTSIGLDIASQTGSTTNIGLRIAKGNTYSLQLSDTGGTAAAGITFGTDTTLYRSAADTLKTDDSFIVGGSLTLSTALAVGQGGTGQTTYTDGQLLIGNTTGNTLAKSTLTGTANQLIVTNGAGSITLSTPQNIGTSSTPTFGGMTLNGSETVNTVQSPTDTDLTIDSYGTGLLKLNSISQATIFVGAPIECDGSGTFTGIAMDANPSAGGAGQPFFLNAGNAASGATNKNGGALIFSAGESTGSGKSPIRFSASVNNAGSTSYNSAVNRLVLNSQVALTSGAAATLLTIPLATLQMAGGILVYIIDCSDGTDMICDSGSVYFAAVNKGGVYTTNSSLLGTDATAKSDITDTISNVFSFSNGSNQTLFQITSTITGQTPTTFRITYQLTSGAYQSITAP